MGIRKKVSLVLFFISISSVVSAARKTSLTSSLPFNPDKLQNIFKQIISSSLNELESSNDSKILDQLQILNAVVTDSSQQLEQLKTRLKKQNITLDDRNVQDQKSLEKPSSDIATWSNGTLKLKNMLGDLMGRMKSVTRELGILETTLDERFPETATKKRRTNRYRSVTIDITPTAEEYLKGLRGAKVGNTFNGSKIQSISAAVPTPYTLTVEIVNYLDLSLHDYKLHLPYGEVHNKAPKAIEARTREIFTFKAPDSSGGNVPEGVFSYKIGGEDFALHLYFYSGTGGFYKQIAAAFLLQSSEVKTIFRKSSIWQGKPIDWPYEHTGSVKLDTTKTINIQKDSTFAKVTFQSKLAAKVKVEVFRFVP